MDDPQGCGAHEGRFMPNRQAKQRAALITIL